MSKIAIDFIVRPATVQSDKQRMNIATLDARALRHLAKGKLFIVFEKPRDFIVIESEVLDYLIQLKAVVGQIDSGTHETVTVSGDYFSNNLRFTYSPQSKTLEIYEVNGGSFKIVTSYKDFRTSLLKCYHQALADLQILYPELQENYEFCRIAK